MKKESAVIDSSLFEQTSDKSIAPCTAEKSATSSEKEYDRLKKDFFSNISHELRTPINVVLGSIQLFEMMGDDLFRESNREKFHTYQRIMKQNCFRLLRLVNNLIDVTKMDSGYVSLSLQNCDMIQMVQDITLKSTRYAAAKGLFLTFQPCLDEVITACDADKIQRVILNLISNSIKFTPQGGQIRVSVRQDEKRVYISVKDTGIGISADKLSGIFERFNPGDSLLTRSHEGSGIGLSLSSSLVRLHGGLIRVNSKPQAGSDFTIELPSRRMEQENGDSAVGSELNLSPAEKVTLELSDLF